MNQTNITLATRKLCDDDTCHILYDVNKPHVWLAMDVPKDFALEIVARWSFCEDLLAAQKIDRRSMVSK